MILIINVRENINGIRECFDEIIGSRIDVAGLQNKWDAVNIILPAPRITLSSAIRISTARLRFGLVEMPSGENMSLPGI